MLEQTELGVRGAKDSGMVMQLWQEQSWNESYPSHPAAQEGSAAAIRGAEGAAADGKKGMQSNQGSIQKVRYKSISAVRRPQSIRYSLDRSYHERCRSLNTPNAAF